jgi:cobalt/nickel transport system permease protein
LKILLPGLLLFTIFLPFLGSPASSAQANAWQTSWSTFHFSLAGLRLAVLFILKAMAIFTIALALTASSPTNATLQAAAALRVPGRLVHLAMLTYRYLFLFAIELGRLRLALRVRGYRNRPTMHCYRTLGNVAGTLLVRSSERAERVGQAMRCRGFDGRFRSLTQFRTRLTDVAAFIVIAAGYSAMLLWEIIG